MICPFCRRRNIPGADTCDFCHASLSDVPSRLSRKTPMEESFETRTLAALNPVTPVCVPPTARVIEVVRLLAEKNIGCVLVVWCDALVGIFSERDVLMKIGTRLDDVADSPIRHFMTPAPETLTLEDTIAFGLNRMAVGDFRHIPIESEEHPVGIVSIRDVLRYVTEQFPESLAPSN